MPSMREAMRSGVEWLYHVELFARADELYGLARRRSYRERRRLASPSSFESMTPVMPSASSKGVRGVHRVLTGHRVNYQQNFCRFDCRLDVLELIHELFINVQAACRVEKDDIVAVLLRVLYGCLWLYPRGLSAPSGTPVCQAARRPSPAVLSRRGGKCRRRRATGACPASSCSPRALRRSWSCPRPCRPTSITTLGSFEEC